MTEIQGKPVYGTCDCKEKRQVLSVEQTADLIQQMASNEWQVPTDYIPKTSVNGIIEQHNGDEVKLWLGTQAEYDALTEEEKAYYLPVITDDPTYQEIMTKLNSLNSSVENINSRLSSLGFRQDNITDASGNIVGTVKRQGNYVIGTIDLSLKDGAIKDLDIEFAPKKSVTFGCQGDLYVYAHCNATLMGGSTGGSLPQITFYSGGGVSVSSGTSVRVSGTSAYAYANPKNLGICNFGYEANPIE